MADGSPDQSVRSLVRLVLLFRLIALNVTVFELPGNPGQVPGVMVGLVLAAFASFLPLRYWDRWGGAIEHATGVPGRWTWCSTSRSTPTSARRARSSSTRWAPRCWPGSCSARTGAVVLGGGMLVGYYVLVVLSGNGLDELRAHEARDIQALVVLPALYPLAAAGGAAVRSAAGPPGRDPGRRWRSAERRAAAGAERARVAREMHDSLGKTLYGIALAARGLSHRVEAEAPGAAAAARDLSAAAQVAAEEARGLISDLRSDTLDRPLGDALDRYVREWSERNGIAAAPAGRRRRPAAPGHALRALLHRARGAGERRAPRRRDAGARCCCATWRPTWSCAWPTTASASTATATRARCRPTATTA